jgi:hypothetical protein
VESKTQFLNTIRDEYLRSTKGAVPEHLLDAVSEAVTEYYYDQYQRFTNQYPKSTKRYSTFKINDLNHPTTFEITIKTLKEKLENDYQNVALQFLNMTLDELRQFESSREQFYKMF